MADNHPNVGDVVDSVRASALPEGSQVRRAGGQGGSILTKRCGLWGGPPRGCSGLAPTEWEVVRVGPFTPSTLGAHQVG